MYKLISDFLLQAHCNDGFRHVYQARYKEYTAHKSLETSICSCTRGWTSHKNLDKSVSRTRPDLIQYHSDLDKSWENSHSIHVCCYSK